MNNETRFPADDLEGLSLVELLTQSSNEYVGGMHYSTEELKARLIAKFLMNEEEE